MTMNTNQKIKITIVFLTIMISIWVYFKIPIRYGLDLAGGTQIILQAKETPTAKVTRESVDGAIEVIRNRIDALGVNEPVIQKKGLDQIIVELPGISDAEHAIKLIGDTALLEFVEAQWAPPNASDLTPEQVEVLAGKNVKLSKYLIYDDQGNVRDEMPIFIGQTVITGADLRNATPGTDQYGKPLVNIEFTKEGTKKFREVTSRSIGKPLAIVLDGKIISAPNVKEAIPSGRAQISGSFSIKEMRDLVIKLKAGALPVPIEVVYNKTIGPMLGKDSIEKSKLAGLVGLLIVCVFMIFNYVGSGVIAMIALAIYFVIVIAVVKLLGATLTMPGIAGFILTMGVAIDANIIIFERVKDERVKGKALGSSVNNGFAKAFITILDANVSVLIAALMLFWLGTGSIKGFAVMLSIGIFVSMFTAIFVSKLMFEGILDRFVDKEKWLLK